MKKFLFFLLAVLVAFTTAAQTQQVAARSFYATGIQNSDSANFAAQNGRLWYGANGFRFTEGGVKYSLKSYISTFFPGGGGGGWPLTGTETFTGDVEMNTDEFYFHLRSGDPTTEYAEFFHRPVDLFFKTATNNYEEFNQIALDETSVNIESYDESNGHSSQIRVNTNDGSGDDSTGIHMIVINAFDEVRQTTIDLQMDSLEIKTPNFLIYDLTEKASPDSIISIDGNGQIYWSAAGSGGGWPLSGDGEFTGNVNVFPDTDGLYEVVVGSNGDESKKISFLGLEAKDGMNINSDGFLTVFADAGIQFQSNGSSDIIFNSADQFTVDAPDVNINSPASVGLTTNDGVEYISNIDLTPSGSLFQTHETTSDRAAGLFTSYSAADLRFHQPIGGLETKIRAGDGNVIISSTQTGFPGATYAADYSADFTNRSLVDKEYVDDAISSGGGWATTGATLLTGNAEIQGANTYNLSIGTSASPIVALSLYGGAIRQTLSGTSWSVGNVSSTWNLTASANNLSWAGSGTGSLSLVANAVGGGNATLGATGASTFVLSTSQQIFTDDSSTKEGLEYAADYSANYSTRSLIDLGFANSRYWATTGTLSLTGDVRINPTASNHFGINVAPVSHIDMGGSVGMGAILTVTTNTTLDVTHHTILVDATSGNVTINLPTVTSISRREYIVKKIDASVNTVTIDPSSTQVIDDATTLVLTTQYQVAQMKSDGAKWWKLN